MQWKWKSSLGFSRRSWGAARFLWLCHEGRRWRRALELLREGWWTLILKRKEFKWEKKKAESCWGGFNENIPHRLEYFNTWSPTCDAVWESGAALLEETCHWEHAWDSIASPHFHHSLFHIYSWRCNLSACCSGQHACSLLPCLPTAIDAHPSGTMSPNKLFLIQVSFCHCAFITSTGK